MHHTLLSRAPHLLTTSYSDHLLNSPFPPTLGSFQHQLPVPIPWPTESANITLGTVFKPAIPQSWVSASVPFYKGVTLVASAATDSAQPMSEPFLSGGAEYSLKLPVVDGPLNHVAGVLQQPLGNHLHPFPYPILSYPILSSLVPSSSLAPLNRI